jgi:3-deoxy-D-manno-octulosonic-acid transferase
MQTELDAGRVKELGAKSDRVAVTGNMKFDAISSGVRYQLSDLGLKSGDLLLIAGSTHNGEEEIIINVYKNLLREFANLKLLIAPRHIERCGYAQAILNKAGISHARFSSITNKPLSAEAIVLDTIGNLSSLYRLADVVFIGGSLIKKGGQNIIEPASFGKPIIFGPHMFNFKDIAQMFLERGAAVKINNKEELRLTARKLLLDKDLRVRIGQLASKIVEENKGATSKTANLIRQNVFLNA